MSALVELQDRIQSTGALIAEHERSVAEIGLNPPRSLLANIRSLEKLRKRLENEYFDIAADMELEVYRYRILNESERVTFAALSEAWSKLGVKESRDRFMCDDPDEHLGHVLSSHCHEAPFFAHYSQGELLLLCCECTKVGYRFQLAYNIEGLANLPKLPFPAPQE